MRILTSDSIRSSNGFGAAKRATEQGLGVTLALWPAVQPWINASRIRRYGDAPGLSLGTLYLLCRPLSQAQSALRAVRDWLVAALAEAVQEAGPA